MVAQLLEVQHSLSRMPPTPDVDDATSAVADAIGTVANARDTQVDVRRLADPVLEALNKLRTGLDQPSQRTRPPAPSPSTGAGSNQSGFRSPETVQEAVAEVRTLRRLISEFRDDRKAGLLRARNSLGATVLATGLTAYAVLWLANGAGVQQEQVQAGFAFFLIGAITGLFSRLYNEAGSETGVDDFGLSFMRLVASPLLSGVAGALGVGVVAVAAAQTQNVSTPASALQNAFSFPLSSIGLLTAAAFGLAPGLLINRLTQAGEDFKKDLKSSEAPGPNTSS
ncbi:MAG: hypothetical protein JO057_14110 [Chloroflexi bacterium]|nr:hypothetical protein [Chloroflexota bacterium]